MKGVIKITCLSLFVLFGTGLVSLAWATYTPLVLDVVENQDWMCSGTNPYGIHNWDNNMTGDTYAALYTVQAMPDQYQVKFSFTLEDNFLWQNWAPLTCPYGEPEFVLAIVEGGTEFPMSVDQLTNKDKTKAKLVYRTMKADVFTVYYGADGDKYWFNGTTWGGGAYLEQISASPYVPYTRKVEIIKDATDYTFNYYDGDDMLMNTVTMPIADVRGNSTDLLTIGDPVFNDYCIKSTIEYMGPVLPLGTYTPLVQGWNSVGSMHTGPLLASNVRFSDDGGITQKTIAEAEAAGWVQGTVYYYDEIEKVYKAVPGDASSFEWSNAHWLYAAQSGITLVMLW
jgi:hypothetical protein